MFHGNHDAAAVLHAGFCLTEDDDAARDYGRPGYGSDGWLHEFELDLSDAPGLVILDVADGYDHDGNAAAGDDGDALGADILIFTDETDTGRRHETYRLMTPAALAACTLTASTSEEY